MKKNIFLPIFFLLNVSNYSLLCMEKEQVKKIVTENGTLLLDEENNLNLIKKTKLLDNVLEIIQSPNNKFAIAICVNKNPSEMKGAHGDGNNIKRYQTTVYNINFKKYAETSPLKVVVPLSLNQLQTLDGKYKFGNCQISEDGKKIAISINKVQHILVNDIVYNK